ncbi:antibiotic biosynthesis monooxygenase [Bacillus sp. HMF5848]|uniref:putative quinol monooxygenase n=1 Tax=Bacillus sp. HMF5848 TaxID=2495421 RepID=UPI000F76A815|nr:putative quinol monooxygenase [Bacillus sp. HMF5848]RSK27669.1 antibiotic biosynthesis monooxygenase [Bacillus sp. HMF5848]
MHIIHAHIKVKSSERETFLDLTKSLISGSQAEPGNISYQLFQDTNDINTFIMVEEWKDLDAIHYHNQTGHFIEFGKKAIDILASPVVVKTFEVKEIL